MPEEETREKINADQLSSATRAMGKYTGNTNAKWFSDDLLPQFQQHREIYENNGDEIVVNAATKWIRENLIKEENYGGMKRDEKRKAIDRDVRTILAEKPGILEDMSRDLKSILIDDLVDVANVRRLDAMPESLRALAMAEYHEDHIAEWKDVKSQLSDMIRYDAKDYPQIYISGPRGTGKSYFEATLITLGMAQKNWIYTTKALNTKYRKYYHIQRRTDLYMDTPQIPSVLRVYMKAKEEEEEYGFPSSLCALVVKDEGGTGGEANYQTNAQKALREEWQFGRHTRGIYITAGFQEYNPKTMELFITHYFQSSAKETIVLDVDGKQRKYYSMRAMFADGSDLRFNVPPSQLAVDSDKGLNIALEYANDLNLLAMFTTCGYSDKMFEKDPEHFIHVFADFAREQRQLYDDAIETALSKKKVKL
jgi:hypothetical protein